MKQELQYKEKGVETLQEWVACGDEGGVSLQFPVVLTSSLPGHVSWSFLGVCFSGFVYARYVPVVSIRSLFLEDTLFLFPWEARSLV